jgi:uncharacterized protein with HEPN domain
MAPGTVRVFGSAARGGAGPSSGVDLRRNGARPKPADFVGLWQELEHLLGLKVDLVGESGISPYCATRSCPKPSLCEQPARLPPPQLRRDRRSHRHTQDGRDAFFADRKTNAVIRNIEVPGQAVKGLSSETRGHDGSIPCLQIAGMRDKLIHEYFGVDLALVWDVVERELPVLRPRLSELAERLSRDAGADAPPRS